MVQVVTPNFETSLPALPLSSRGTGHANGLMTRSGPQIGRTRRRRPSHPQVVAAAQRHYRGSPPKVPLLPLPSSNSATLSHGLHVQRGSSFGGSGSQSSRYHGERPSPSSTVELVDDGHGRPMSTHTDDESPTNNTMTGSQTERAHAIPRIGRIGRRSRMAATTSGVDKGNDGHVRGDEKEPSITEVELDIDEEHIIRGGGGSSSSQQQPPLAAGSAWNASIDASAQSSPSPERKHMSSDGDSRRAVFAYLSSPQCGLFSSAYEVRIGLAEMDLLLREGGGSAEETILLCRQLDRNGVKVLGLAPLLIAIRQLRRAQSQPSFDATAATSATTTTPSGNISDVMNPYSHGNGPASARVPRGYQRYSESQRRELVDFFASPNCVLFNSLDDQEIRQHQLDAMLALGPIVLSHLNFLNSVGNQYRNFNELMSAVSEHHRIYRMVKPVSAVLRIFTLAALIVEAHSSPFDAGWEYRQFYHSYVHQHVH
jgi:hypothetical protein